MNSKQSIQAKHNMNRCPIHIILPILTIFLPYASTLNLPSGDPAPGRSPGPPFSEIIDLEDYDETTTSEVTTMQVITDACEYARISSESEQMVTLSETESEVNLTVSHAIFDTAELVKGVVYDVHLQFSSLHLWDYVLHSTIGASISGNFTPTSYSETPCLAPPYFIPKRKTRAHMWSSEFRTRSVYFKPRRVRSIRKRFHRFIPALVVSGPLGGRNGVVLKWSTDSVNLDKEETSVVSRIVCGLMSALWVWLHRQYVLFIRNTKCLSTFLQKNRFIYPGFITLAVMSILFPPGIGKYMAGGLGTPPQVSALFSNFTWSDELTAEQAAIVSNWQTPEVDHFGCLIIYFFSIYFLSMVSCTLPVPAGIFVPAFKMGASLGRFTGEVMHYFCPLGVAYGGRIHKILPGGYATVGAAAFTGAVTHTVSTIVIIIEMTGQITHLLPIMAAVLAANAVAAVLQPSCFDSIILIKKLPYLPDLLSSASRK